MPSPGERSGAGPREAIIRRGWKLGALLSLRCVNRYGHTSVRCFRPEPPGDGRRREEEGRGGMWGWAGERNHMEQDQLNPSLMAGRQANDPTSAGAGSIPAAILKSNGAPILQFPMELLKIQNWVEQTRRAAEKAEREDHLSGSNWQLAILAEEEPVCSNGEGGGGGRRGRGGRGRWFHRSGTNAPSPQSTE